MLLSASRRMKPNGCHNRAPYKSSVVVQDGWEYMGSTRIPIVKEVPFVMTTDCNYKTTELGKNDERCNGCKWK